MEEYLQLITAIITFGQAIISLSSTTKRLNPSQTTLSITVKKGLFKFERTKKNT